VTPSSHPALDDLCAWAATMPWITDVLLYGSLASGDHCPATSDIDVVAVTTGPVSHAQRASLVSVHRRIDATTGRGARLGCVYVPAAHRHDVARSHATWTHGRLVQRPLSAMARAELLQTGVTVVGRAAGELLSPMSADDVRQAARAELVGYWSWTLRRPWLFLDHRIADLALLTMARARHTCLTGSVQTKSAAWAGIRAPRGVADGVRRRRDGSGATLPPFGPWTGWHAWRDTRRTVAENGRA